VLDSSDEGRHCVAAPGRRDADRGRDAVGDGEEEKAESFGASVAYGQYPIACF